MSNLRSRVARLTERAEMAAREVPQHVTPEEFAAALALPGGQGVEALFRLYCRQLSCCSGPAEGSEERVRELRRLPHEELLRLYREQIGEPACR